MVMVEDDAEERLHIEIIEHVACRKWLWRAVDDPLRTGYVTASACPPDTKVGTHFRARATGGRFDTELLPLEEPDPARPTTLATHPGPRIPKNVERFEPGTIILATIRFSHMPGPRDLGKEAKVRPCVVSRDHGDWICIRAIFNGTDSFKKRNGAPEIEEWQEAGLLKPSVLDPSDREIAPNQVIRVIGALTSRDAGRHQVFRSR